MPAGKLPDHTYSRQEVLRLHTAANSFGVVYFRLLNLFILPLIALSQLESIGEPMWFWPLLLIYMGINAQQLVSHFFARNNFDKWWYLVVLDSSAILGLAALSGWFDSGYRYLFVFLVLYSIVRLNWRDTIKLTLLSLAAVFTLFWMSHAPVTQLATLGLIIVGMSWFACEIIHLINSSHQHVMRSLNKQIEATNTVKSHENLLQQEILERKNAQGALIAARDKAVAASEAKTRFMANMSHELRTPLNVILGYSEVLLEDARDTGNNAQTADLSRIYNAGHHLLQLIDGILDISMIEQNTTPLKLEEVDLSGELATLVDTTLTLAEKNNNHISLHCAPEVGMVCTDPTKLNQILLNLISNACKFTSDGHIRIEASKFPYQDKDWISINVSDTGIGIPKEKLDSIFDAFGQVDDSETRGFGGVGLGLTLSRNYCHLLGGELSVQSTLGKGTSFCIRMPANVERSMLYEGDKMTGTY